MGVKQASILNILDEIKSLKVKRRQIGRASIFSKKEGEENGKGGKRESLKLIEKVVKLVKGAEEIIFKSILLIFFKSYRIFQMRNFSKEHSNKPLNTYTPLRSCTSQKRLSDYFHHPSNEYLRVGTYKYREQDLLGKGFSSKVYKAFNHKNDTQIYAIKVIDLKKFKTSNMMMLENQIKVHQSLSHPNIVKCYDVYKTQQYYYIVTEYCPNGDLLQNMTKKLTIDEDKALEIMKQIIEGYKYLMKRGVLHRDLKPANILRSGNSWKIGDFGFSTFSKHQYILDSINVGTPLYMPPQSFRSNKYSIKTDIFAIGVIFYEILVGKTPWQSRTEKELIHKMQTVKIKIPSNINNPQIKLFLQKSCEVDEFKRLSKEGLGQFFQEKPISNPQQSNVKKNSLVSINLLNQEVKKIVKKGSSASTENSEGEVSIGLEEIFKKNTEKLISELQFCRHVYYMIVNIDHFLFDKVKKDFFLMVLFKHLLRYIKLIQDSKINVFSLSCWEKYKASSYYLNLYPQIKAYEKRYQKQYLDHLKNAQITIIRSVNRKFPELSYTTSLNNNFYIPFKNYISGLLRMLNHDVMKKTRNFESSKYYQTIQSMYIYYLGLEERSEGKEFGLFKDKIIIDYQKSKLSQEDFQSLRQKIKLL